MRAFSHWARHLEIIDREHGLLRILHRYEEPLLERLDRVHEVAARTEAGIVRSNTILFGCDRRFLKAIGYLIRERQREVLGVTETTARMPVRPAAEGRGIQTA